MNLGCWATSLFQRLSSRCAGWDSRSCYTSILLGIPEAPSQLRSCVAWGSRRCSITQLCCLRRASSEPIPNATARPFRWGSRLLTFFQVPLQTLSNIGGESMERDGHLRIGRLVILGPDLQLSCEQAATGCNQGSLPNSSLIWVEFLTDEEFGVTRIDRFAKNAASSS
ncbi:hypothetical protein CI102_12916 [Trichoderma harzianum]|nr:hypothetical protein CI102_12916 [Trichoderma harzianum]